MRLYCVDPDVLDTEPEGEDRKEWFTQLRDARRFAREQIAKMEQHDRDAVEGDSSWLTGCVRLSVYETRQPLTVKWLTKALSYSGGAWSRIELLETFEMKGAR